VKDHKHNKAAETPGGVVVNTPIKGSYHRKISQ